MFEVKLGIPAVKRNVFSAKVSLSLNVKGYLLVSCLKNVLIFLRNSVSFVVTVKPKSSENHIIVYRKPANYLVGFYERFIHT